MAMCACGCGQEVAKGRRFVSGHNLRGLPRSKEHSRKIGEAQRRAWDTKRTRFPMGQKRVHKHDGYVVVKVHPGKGPWRGEHLIVMEALLGRPLTDQEIVHHINAVRAANDADNLYLCRDRSHHNEVHNSYDALLVGLMEDGIVRFNRETGRYERADQTLLSRRE